MGDGLHFLRIVLTLGIVVVATVDQCRAQSVCQDARLTAFDAGVFQSFGYAVGLSQDIMVIGAIWDNDNGTQSGSVYIYELGSRSPQEWVFKQKLLASDGNSDDLFGYTLAIQDELAVIGAPGHVDASAPGTGTVFMFGFDPNLSAWTEHQELYASDGAWQDGFGAAVSLSGEVALIGALFDDDNGAQSGSAYVFRFHPDTSQWVEEQKLLASNGSAGSFFGSSVAVEGPLAVVGADLHINNNNTAGAAYVFRYNPKTQMWVQEQILRPSDGAGGTNFGSSVSISGDLMLVGAYSEGNGAAYVFRLNPKTSQWEMEQKFVASDPGGIDQFGRSVAIDGAPGNETAVVGAWSSNAGGLSSGAAYIYRFDSDASEWIEQALVLPEPNAWTNFFGWSVALDGETTVIGAHGEDQQRGAAYVFDLAPNCNCPHDLDADGSVGVPDLLWLLGSWGPCPPKVDCPADFDDSGDVGVKDLLFLLGNWGPCP